MRLLLTGYRLVATRQISPSAGVTKAGPNEGCVKPILKIVGIRPARRSEKLVLTRRQCAAHGVLPAAPFAVARRRVHVRLEAPVEPPGRREPVQIGANARLVPCEIGCAERGRFHEYR